MGKQQPFRITQSLISENRHAIGGTEPFQLWRHIGGAIELRRSRCSFANEGNQITCRPPPRNARLIRIIYFIEFKFNAGFSSRYWSSGVRKG
jgi:hypothetical protein